MDSNKLEVTKITSTTPNEIPDYTHIDEEAIHTICPECGEEYYISEGDEDHHYCF